MVTKVLNRLKIQFFLGFYTIPKTAASYNNLALLFLSSVYNTHPLKAETCRAVFPLTSVAALFDPPLSKRYSTEFKCPFHEAKIKGVFPFLSLASTSEPPASMNSFTIDK